MADPIDRLLASLAADHLEPVYLVVGDLILVEPAARQLAEAVAAKVGAQVEERRRPPSLGTILEDLRTYSLFAPAKVTLVVDCAVLADKNDAVELLDDVAENLPAGGAAELSAKERLAASRLLQVLRLFDLDADAGEPKDLVDELPDWVLAGGKGDSGKRKGRSKAQVEELRGHLTELLGRARLAELTGWAETELAQIMDVVHGGLPRNHCLVLAERTVATDHPLARALEERGALVRYATIEAEKRGGWSGLDLVAAQLEKETGVGIDRGALEELARRTLRQGEGWGGAERPEADATARLAAEYRKLAAISSRGKIHRETVEQEVLDRGQEDVWKIFDAVSDGRADVALARLRRYLATSADPISARLAFFSLLAGFCRQLTAIRGLMKTASMPANERAYNRFRDRLAPALQAPLPAGGKNPLAGLHPFRLFRAYVAAGRLRQRDADLLPWKVLETELLLKGESTEGEAALASLLVSLTRPTA